MYRTLNRNHRVFTYYCSILGRRFGIYVLYLRTKKKLYQLLDIAICHLYFPQILDAYKSAIHEFIFQEKVFAFWAVCKHDVGLHWSLLVAQTSEQLHDTTKENMLEYMHLFCLYLKDSNQRPVYKFKKKLELPHLQEKHCTAMLVHI